MPGYRGGMALEFILRPGYTVGHNKISHGMFSAVFYGPRGEIINL